MVRRKEKLNFPQVQFVLKIKEKGETVLYLTRTRNYRKVVNSLLQSGQHDHFYVRAIYGPYTDSFGDEVVFDNRGHYSTKEAAFAALQDFSEPDLLAYLRS